MRRQSENFARAALYLAFPALMLLTLCSACEHPKPQIEVGVPDYPEGISIPGVVSHDIATGEVTVTADHVVTETLTVVGLRGSARGAADAIANLAVSNAELVLLNAEKLQDIEQRLGELEQGHLR